MLPARNAVPRKFVKLICVLSLATIYLCVTAVLIGALHVMKHRKINEYPDSLLKSLAGPLEYDDPSLLEYVANEILVPPSTLPYHLTGNIISKIRLPSEAFYARNLRLIFNTTKKGFFVEAGALDGEAMSNTLWLEKRQGWTGLLVEPDPAQFLALKSKHRKAWSANVCLSIEKFPKVEMLSSVDIGDAKERAMGFIVQPESELQGIESNHAYSSYYTSQCFPLGSLLLAMNVTKIDLLSLDVEFVEEIILQKFDFKTFDVQVLFIEHHNYKTIRRLHDFLVKKGYEFVINDAADYIYCKTGTEISERLKDLYPTRYLVETFTHPNNPTE